MNEMLSSRRVENNDKTTAAPAETKRLLWDPEHAQIPRLCVAAVSCCLVVPVRCMVVF